MNISMMNTVVFFDVDNTLIDGYSQKYFIRYLFHKKYINIFNLILGNCWFLLYKLNIVRDIDKAINYLLSFLGAMSKAEIDSMMDDFFISHIKSNIFTDAITRVRWHQKNKHHIILLSNSLCPIVSRLANFLKVKDFFCTKLDYNDNVCLGKVSGRVLTGEQKLEKAKIFISKAGGTKIESFFYTDHHSDLSLLKFVDQPIIVNPDKVLLRYAKNNNWKVLKYNKKI